MAITQRTINLKIQVEGQEELDELFQSGIVGSRSIDGLTESIKKMQAQLKTIDVKTPQWAKLNENISKAQSTYSKLTNSIQTNTAAIQRQELELKAAENSYGGLTARIALLNDMLRETDFNSPQFEVLKTSLQQANTQAETLRNSFAGISPSEKLESFMLTLQGVAGLMGTVQGITAAFADDLNITTQEQEDLNKSMMKWMVIMQGMQVMTESFGSQNKVLKGLLADMFPSWNKGTSAINTQTRALNGLSDAAANAAGNVAGVAAGAAGGAVGGGVAAGAAVAGAADISRRSSLLRANEELRDYSNSLSDVSGKIIKNNTNISKANALLQSQAANLKSLSDAYGEVLKVEGRLKSAYDDKGNLKPGITQEEYSKRILDFNKRDTGAQGAYEKANKEKEALEKGIKAVEEQNKAYLEQEEGLKKRIDLKNEEIALLENQTEEVVKQQGIFARLGTSITTSFSAWFWGLTGIILLFTGLTKVMTKTNREWSDAFNNMMASLDRFGNSVRDFFSMLTNGWLKSSGQVAMEKYFERLNMIQKSNASLLDQQIAINQALEEYYKIGLQGEQSLAAQRKTGVNFYEVRRGLFQKQVTQGEQQVDTSVGELGNLFATWLEKETKTVLTQEDRNKIANSIKINSEKLMDGSISTMEELIENNMQALVELFGNTYVETKGWSVSNISQNRKYRSQYNNKYNTPDSLNYPGNPIPIKLFTPVEPKFVKFDNSWSISNMNNNVPDSLKTMSNISYAKKEPKYAPLNFVDGTGYSFTQKDAKETFDYFLKEVPKMEEGQKIYSKFLEARNRVVTGSAGVASETERETIDRLNEALRKLQANMESNELSVYKNDLLGLAIAEDKWKAILESNTVLIQNRVAEIKFLAALNDDEVKLLEKQTAGYSEYNDEIIKAVGIEHQLKLNKDNNIKLMRQEIAQAERQREIDLLNLQISKNDTENDRRRVNAKWDLFIVKKEVAIATEIEMTYTKLLNNELEKNVNLMNKQIEAVTRMNKERKSQSDVISAGLSTDRENVILNNGLWNDYNDILIDVRNNTKGMRSENMKDMAAELALAKRLRDDEEDRIRGEFKAKYDKIGEDLVTLTKGLDSQSTLAQDYKQKAEADRKALDDEKDKTIEKLNQETIAKRNNIIEQSITKNTVEQLQNIEDINKEKERSNTIALNEINARQRGYSNSEYDELAKKLNLSKEELAILKSKNLIDSANTKQVYLQNILIERRNAKELEQYNLKIKSIKEQAKAYEDLLKLQGKWNDQTAADVKEWERLQIRSVENPLPTPLVDVDPDAKLKKMEELGNSLLSGASQIGQAYISVLIDDLDREIERLSKELDLIDKQLSNREARLSDLKNKIGDQEGAAREAAIKDLEREQSANDALLATRERLIKQQERAQKEQIKLQKRQALVSAAQAVAQSTLAIASLAASSAPRDLTFGIATIAAVVALTTSLLAASSQLKGSFEVGGYTGKDGETDPNRPGERIAGVVHTDEYVIPRRVLRTKEGRQIAQWAEEMRNGIRPNMVSETAALAQAEAGYPQRRSQWTDGETVVSVKEIVKGIDRVKVIETR